MKRFKIVLCSALVMTCQLVTGQNVTGGDVMDIGQSDTNIVSISQRVFNLEKKTDAFNFYVNYAFSGSESNEKGPWQARFFARQIRLEIKGNITDKLFYRFRHRLNRSNAAKGWDNFAKATDYLMVGYRFSKQWSVSLGKKSQAWGGFEYDENPVYIYQFSDFQNNMDNAKVGAMVAFSPISSQEFIAEVTGTNNGTFNEDFGDDVMLVSKNVNNVTPVETSNNPLTYILGWNGSFLDNKLQTRWSYGFMSQARGLYARSWIFGQKLNLDRFQLYFDYMGEWNDMDRLGIATSDLKGFVQSDIASNPRFSKVHYNTFITKMNWQFIPQWNLMLKGTYETASVTSIKEYKNYRKSIAYFASIEYYPVKDQDLRVFLAFLGHSYVFNKTCGLSDYNTANIELGFKYRMKLF